MKKFKIETQDIIDHLNEQIEDMSDKLEQVKKTTKSATRVYRQVGIIDGLNFAQDTIKTLAHWPINNVVKSYTAECSECHKHFTVDDYQQQIGYRAICNQCLKTLPHWILTNEAGAIEVTEGEAVTLLSKILNYQGLKDFIKYDVEKFSDRETPIPNQELKNYENDLFNQLWELLANLKTEQESIIEEKKLTYKNPSQWYFIQGYLQALKEVSTFLKTV